MWYDNVSLNTDYNYISSRIRLARNFDNALFPSKLSDTEAKKLITIIWHRHAITTNILFKFQKIYPFLYIHQRKVPRIIYS